MKKILRKGTALLLALAMVVTMMPMLPAEMVQAATTGTSASGSDAFSALGIDTSVAPEGFDPNSIDNPYGRDTIKVNTVSELYTVQMGDSGNKPGGDLSQGCCRFYWSARGNGCQYTINFQE